MDAHALLSAQGWRGTGHSLHKTDDAIGLAKPLLLNRKTNTKGLGNTKHFTSDMWWMNAFDEQLKGLDTSKKGQVVQTVKTGKLNALDRGNVSKYSVYASFVRGGFLEGTLSVETTTDDSTSSDSEKSDDKKTEAKATKPKKESKEEKRVRKEEKKKRKEARALRRAAKAERRLRRAEAKKDTSDSSSSGKEDKLLRRARKEEKRKRKELKKEKN
ncbi:hypothetical protein GGI43DRAFT_285489 [Trichoderma evansii]